MYGCTFVWKSVGRCFYVWFEAACEMSLLWDTCALGLSDSVWLELITSLKTWQTHSGTTCAAQEEKLLKCFLIHSNHFTLQGIILAFFKKNIKITYTHTHTQTHTHIDGCIKGSFLGSSCCPRAFPHVHWGGADDQIPDLVISVWAALPPNLPHIYIQ